MPIGQSITDEQVAIACALIASGKSHRAAAEEIGVNRQTLLIALQSDAHALAYARAREARSGVKQDEMDDLNERVLAGEVPPDVARVLLGNWQWQMGRMDGKRWGDKIQQDINATVSNAFAVPQTETDSATWLAKHRQS